MKLCISCKHWKASDYQRNPIDSKYFNCETNYAECDVLIRILDIDLKADGYATIDDIYTNQDFGCVEWESLDKTPEL